MSGDPVTLFLCGDLMTRRGVDQILAHPSAPDLHESWVHDAREAIDHPGRAEGWVGWLAAQLNLLRAMCVKVYSFIV